MPFAEPATLLISPDHDLFRLLHAAGVELRELGVGPGELTEKQARRACRLLCSNSEVFRGTPVRYWLQIELADVFGVIDRPSAASADSIYDDDCPVGCVSRMFGEPALVGAEEIA